MQQCPWLCVNIRKYNLYNLNHALKLLKCVAPCTAEPPLAEGAKPLSHKQIFALVLW